MIELLESGSIDNSLLCELAAHPDFPRFMADLEIYVNGIAGKQVQSANAIVDAMSATIMKQYNPGLTDPQLRQLITAHIDEDSFCRHIIQQDINTIALDLREAHRDDFFSVPEDNPLKGFLQTLMRLLARTATQTKYLWRLSATAQIEFEKAVRGRKEMAEKDCGEIGFAEKSKPAAGEEIVKTKNQNVRG